jgi:hypothetical protein
MVGGGSCAVTTGTNSNEKMAMEMQAETARGNRDVEKLVSESPFALQVALDAERLEATFVFFTAQAVGRIYRF